MLQHRAPAAPGSSPRQGELTVQAEESWSRGASAKYVDENAREYSCIATVCPQLARSKAKSQARGNKRAAEPSYCWCCWRKKLASKRSTPLAPPCCATQRGALLRDEPIMSCTHEPADPAEATSRARRRRRQGTVHGDNAFRLLPALGTAEQEKAPQT